MFKSDQQNPVEANQKELAARQPEMKLENSPTDHSAANGMLKDADIKQAVEPNTPVMTFMVDHAATIINRFSVDQDGMAPMEKARGTTANREMAEFGEKILFEPMTKYNKMNKLGVRWQYGFVMGVATRTNEIMVSGPDGNERSLTFGRLPEDKRLDAEAVMSVKGSPSGTEFEWKITADPAKNRTWRQAAGKASTCVAVPIVAQVHRAVRAHTRMQRMPSRKSSNHAAIT